MTCASAQGNVAERSPSSDSDLSGALADVVEALEHSTATHLELMETRMIAKARGAVVGALTWSAGLAAALVAWGCANVALGTWLSAAYGSVTASVVATAIHACAALALILRARVGIPSDLQAST